MNAINLTYYSRTRLVRTLSGIENKYVLSECAAYPSLLYIEIHINLQIWFLKLVRTKPKYVLTQVRTNRVLLYYKWKLSPVLKGRSN